MPKINITHQLTWQGFQFLDILNKESLPKEEAKENRKGFFLSILASLLVVIILAATLRFVGSTLVKKEKDNQLDISIPIQRQVALV